MSDSEFLQNVIEEIEKNDSSSEWRGSLTQWMKC